MPRITIYLDDFTAVVSGFVGAKKSVLGDHVLGGVGMSANSRNIIEEWQNE